MTLLMKARLVAVVSLSLAAIAICVRLIISPDPQRPPSPVVFPTAIAGWQTLDLPPDPALPNTQRYRRDPLELELQFIPDLPVHYVYNPQLELRFLPRGHLPLDAALHFYLSGRDGIITNLRTDRPIDAVIEHRQLDASTAYGLWTANQRLHLSSVITPSGTAGIATRRVARHLYLDPLSPRVVGKWLLGQATLPDRRCVLVHLSLPMDAPGNDTNRRALEQAWADWRAAYRPAFPELGGS